MRATKFEFEKRFWIISGIYAVGFGLSVFDHTRFLAGLDWTVPSIVAGSPQELVFIRVVITAGTFLVFLAAAFRTWAAAYLRTVVVHDTAQHFEVLVADGPFRHVRNPLYFANLPMALGIGVLASWLGFLFIVGANWLFVYRLILREEAALRERQGESYDAYCKAVPRFWPSLRPRMPSGHRAPQWGQAFAGEIFVWLFGAAELCLAITLNTKLAIGLFALGFVSHFWRPRVGRGKGRKALEDCHY